MTLKQTERLLKLLAQYEVFHYKTSEIEVNRNAAGELHPISPKSPDEAIAENTVQSPPKPLGDIPPSTLNIPHEVNKVASLLKMSDEALVDALFPEAPPEE